MSRIHYLNHILLASNGYLSTCCCDVNDKYFEASPCDLQIQLRSSICKEWDICQLANRKYVGLHTKCQGTANKVCECQVLEIQYSDNLLEGNVTEAVSLEYLGTNIPAMAELTDTELILTENGVGSIHITLANKTIADLSNEINVNYPQWQFLWIGPTIYLNSAQFLLPATLNFAAQYDTLYFASRNTGLAFYYNGIKSPYVEYHSSMSHFADDIQTMLQSFIGPDVTCQVNRDRVNIQGYLENYLEITFGGNLCGTPQPFMSVAINGLLYAGFSYFVQSEFHYGVYETNEFYGGSLLYFRNQTNQECPYEDLTGDGPIPFNPNIQCCPQRGCTLGPNQPITAAISGYQYALCGVDSVCQYCVLTDGIGKCWANLDRTFVVPGASGADASGCYNLSPYYFIFGKTGRFDTDPYYAQQLFVPPDCDYSDPNADCNQQQLPCNCTPQLFMPYLNPNVPWGPFGAYYPDIEDAIHEAYLPPYNDPAFPSGQSYLSANIVGTYSFNGERVGFDYRPWGWLKFLGTWQETKLIVAKVEIHRPMPFYVGSAEWDDINYLIEIDDTTITNPNLTYSPSGGSSLGCTATTFVFDTSGQTVGDFVSAMNAIKIKDFGCNIFSFCPASSGSMNIPATRIMNISSELYEQRVAGGVDCGAFCPPAYDANGPETDDERWSGCDLIPEPRRYQDTFTQNPENPGTAQYYNLPLLADNSLNYLRRSPQCRLFKDKPPKKDDGTSPFFNGLGTLNAKDHISPETDLVNCWVTAMVGCNFDVIYVSKNTSITSDPFSYLNIWSSGRAIYLEGSGIINGTGFVSTGYINTNHSGNEYKVTDCISDLNNLKFTYIGSTGMYNPIIATSGLDFDVWLDDGTSMSGTIGSPFSAREFLYGSSGNFPTAYNFSYLEPLLDSNKFDLNLGRSANFQCWIRKRCGASGSSLDTGGTAPISLDTGAPPYCVPPDGDKINSDIACGGDKYIVGSWIISYGCASYVCRTEWYIPSTRCPCSTVYRCLGENNGANLPHPYNQSEFGVNEPYYAALGLPGVSCTQPLLYVCDLNFHPECDIPMMVKVPFQFFFDNDPSNILWQYGQDPVDFNLGVSDFCIDRPLGDPFQSNLYGWCQYIDPTGPKVRKQDIPMADPPISYIAQRSVGTFCSIHPWNFDPRYIFYGGIPTEYTNGIFSPLPAGCKECDDPNVQDCLDFPECAGGGWACASCDNWDRIENLGVVFAEGIYYTNNPTPLRALFRPILKNITQTDVCGSGVACNRLDIDCATTCCECAFTCNNGCNTDLSQQPYQYTVTYSNNMVQDNLPWGCDLYYTSMPCFVAVGCCDGAPQYAWITPCADGTETITTNGSASYTYVTCGCQGGGSETTTYACSATCTCDGGGMCYAWQEAMCPDPQTIIYDCANLPPSILGSNRCCGGGTCADPGCYNLLRNDGGNCPRCQGYCDEIFNECQSQTGDNCGIAGDYQSTWTWNNQAVCEGTSACDGHALELIELNTLMYTETITGGGSYHKTAIAYTVCTDGTDVTPKSYNYVINWPFNITGWICYSANSMVSTAGTGDARFHGTTNCF